jgi:hypothetical protein
MPDLQMAASKSGRTDIFETIDCIFQFGDAIATFPFQTEWHINDGLQITGGNKDG